jgi:hypothetical protein
VLGKSTEIERRTQKFRQEILEELVNLIESTERRRRAIELIEELRVADQMLLHARPQAIIGSYSSFRDPSHAVAAYLKLRGTPATLDEILDALFSGGFRGGQRDDFELSVKMAIHNRLTLAKDKSASNTA